MALTRMKRLELTGRKGSFLMLLGPSENIVSVAQGNGKVDGVKMVNVRWKLFMLRFLSIGRFSKAATL